MEDEDGVAGAHPEASWYYGRVIANKNNHLGRLIERRRGQWRQ